MKYWRNSKASAESIERRRLVNYAEDGHVFATFLPHEVVRWHNLVFYKVFLILVLLMDSILTPGLLHFHKV